MLGAMSVDADPVILEVAYVPDAPAAAVNFE